MPVAVAVLDDAKETSAVAAIPVAPAAPPANLPPPAAVQSVAKTSLAAKVDALLQQAVAAAKDETTPPGPIDLGERARDLIQLMVAPPVTISEGDIRKTYDNFDGSDRWFEWGGGRVRIVTSDAMRGSFIAVLERLKEAAGDTLLLRNYFAPVSGQLTMELLNTFKAKNTFHHIPASEAAILVALGSMLAAQREGSYDQLATEPPSTKDNVLAALREHSLLRGLRFWEMIQKVHAPKHVPGPPQSSVLSSIIRPSAPPMAKPPIVPAATPPVMPAAMPPPAAASVKPPVVPGAMPPPATGVKPPLMPGAKPPPPPSYSGATKPLAKPPSAPIPKPIAKPPAPPMMKPPMSKLPPPSQGTAA